MSYPQKSRQRRTTWWRDRRTADYIISDAKTRETYVEYRRSREEMRELLAAKVNVDRFLNMETEHNAEREKDHGQR